MSLCLFYSPGLHLQRKLRSRSAPRGRPFPLPWDRGPCPQWLTEVCPARGPVPGRPAASAGTRSPVPEGRRGSARGRVARWQEGGVGRGDGSARRLLLRAVPNYLGQLGRGFPGAGGAPSVPSGLRAAPRP